MSSQKLTKAPLVEAILEMRWGLSEPVPGVRTDPKYKILVGRLYDRLEKDYPFHEPLPAASMPDEMLGYVVQHRFRTAEGKWPLVQVGPGIITLNATQNYTWDDFEPRSRQVQQCLFAAYPEAPASLVVSRLRLRYIDAISFDFERENIFTFMLEKLKINLAFPPAIYQNAPILPLPAGLNMLFAFPTTDPKGIIQLRFGRGVRNKQSALIWETIVQSEGSDVPKMPDGFEPWLTGAHTLTHNLFFKLIEGSLEEGFR